MICTKCGEDFPNTDFPSDKSRPKGFYPHCKICNRKRVKAYSDKIKKMVFNHYSCDRMECACCGEKFLEFLVLDHINGGGRKQREQLKCGPQGRQGLH